MGRHLTHMKTIQIRVSNRVGKQIGVLADQEGRSVAEMAQILLEDALALRQTIRSQNRPAKPK
jgi:hypothetical protein